MVKTQARRYKRHIPETTVVQDEKKGDQAIYKPHIPETIVVQDENGDQAIYKRQPIDHACVECRRRKIRCWLVEDEPCLSCTKKKLKCDEEDDHLRWLAEIGVKLEAENEII